MPSSEARARGPKNVIWFARVRHYPIPGSLLANDEWLVPFAVSYAASQRLGHLRPQSASQKDYSLEAAVTFAGEGPVLNGYAPDTLRVVLYRSYASHKATLANRVALLQRTMQPHTPFLPPGGEVLAVLRQVSPLYVYQDEVEEISEERQQDVAGAHPMAYWISRDLQERVEPAGRAIVRFEIFQGDLRALKALSRGPTKEMPRIRVADAEGIGSVQQYLDDESALLHRAGPVSAHGAPFGPLPDRLPLRTNLEVSWNEAYAGEDVTTDEMAYVDLTPTRNKPFGRGFVVPVLDPEPEEEEP